MLEVTSKLDRKKISNKEDYEGNLMVSIKAEEESVDRTPVCVALVLDVSGSMSSRCESGCSKLEAVKDVAASVVRNLTSKDKLAIVSYDTGVYVNLKMSDAGNKEVALAAIEGLTTGSCTNMSGGMLEGFGQIDTEFDGVQRIMLLTDGLANVGVSDRDGLMGLIRDRESQSITLSTFGFGDADQELLADMAKAGGGNYYFIKDGRDCKSVFARELGGIASCVAQGIEVTVDPNKGNEILEVLNNFDVEELEDGAVKIKAEDIYIGENKHIILKTKVCAPVKAKARPFSVAKVNVKYVDVKTSKREEKNLNPKVSFVKPDDADKEALLEIDEQVALITAAKAQINAVKLANAGDFAGAQQAFFSASNVVRACSARGSNMSLGVDRELAKSAELMNAHTYTPEYGTSVVSSAEGAVKYRATHSVSGGLSNLFANKSMKDMEDKFGSEAKEDATGAKENAVAPGLAMPNLVVDKKEKKKLGKKKKGRR